MDRLRVGDVVYYTGEFDFLNLVRLTVTKCLGGSVVLTNRHGWEYETRLGSTYIEKDARKAYLKVLETL